MCCEQSQTAGHAHGKTLAEAYDWSHTEYRLAYIKHNVTFETTTEGLSETDNLQKISIAESVQFLSPDEIKLQSQLVCFIQTSVASHFK